MKYLFYSKDKKFETDNFGMYDEIYELCNDEEIEDWLNEGFYDFKFPFLENIELGEIVRILAGTDDERFSRLWGDIKNDYVQCTTEALLDELSWEGRTQYQNYVITEIEE